MKEKSWEEFRDSGLLWWINMILHTFGWAIVVEIKGNEIKRAYPARVKYRGFTEKDNSNGYIKVSEYIKGNADDILKESKE
ncbi:hypothetical protein ABFY48_01735 [Lysinibacillus pakistanensis]|uniref:hypothetical protein n=1 Tax=Lysinibacillus pakistanensis TaxID=759811 RepID=UPI003D2B1F1A